MLLATQNCSTSKISHSENALSDHGLLLSPISPKPSMHQILIPSAILCLTNPHLGTLLSQLSCANWIHSATLPQLIPGPPNSSSLLIGFQCHVSSWLIKTSTVNYALFPGNFKLSPQCSADGFTSHFVNFYLYLPYFASPLFLPVSISYPIFAKLYPVYLHPWYYVNLIFLFLPWSNLET